MSGQSVAGDAAVSETAPVLVEARAQALLIGGLRLILALVVLALARARGLDLRPAVGLLAFGCFVLLFALLAGSGRRRTDARIAETKDPPPPDAVVESRWRSLLKATYPSTIAVTIGAVIALAVNLSLAAVLAGILAGLGIAALIAAGRVYLWERELHGRLLAERGRDGRIFVGATG
jgi:hypothetical protein